MLDRRQFLGALGASLAAAQPAGRKPNIVFILADDLGYGDLGCYGQRQIATPNIDRLARDGTRFTQAYAGSTVCAPSRCCLMTGVHTGHARIRGNGAKNPIRAEDITIAEVLKRAGYRTGMFGKWALGELGDSGYPTKRGWDEWFGWFSQGYAHTYYPELLLSNDTAVILRGNFGVRKRTDYGPDLCLDRALKFLEKKDDRPFFLYFPSIIPHANNEMGRDTGNGMEVPTDAPYSDKSWPQVEKNFAAAITRLDSYVGKLMAQLDKMGVADNTLVFFSSDNGAHLEGGHSEKFFESSGALRGHKRDPYEGGIRVPLIARWPGHVKAGRVSDFQCAFWDFLPTLSEIAGEKTPPGLDGISIRAELEGRPQRPHDYLYWEFHERAFAQALRQGDWKLVRTEDDKLELYNLNADLSERGDQAAKKPDMVKSMAALMASARTDSPEFPVKPTSRRSGNRND